MRRGGGDDVTEDQETLVLDALLGIESALQEQNKTLRELVESLKAQGKNSWAVRREGGET